MPLTDKQLEEMIRKRRENLARAKNRASPTASTNPVRAALRSFGQDATFGFSDEIAAGLRALSPSVTYEDAIKEERRILERGKKDAPWSSAAGSLAGMLTGGGALMKAGTAATKIPYNALTRKGQIGRGAVEGAIGGSVAGVGYGEGEDRAKGLMSGGALGGGLGSAFPYVGTLGGATRLMALGRAKLGKKAGINPAKSDKTLKRIDELREARGKRDAAKRIDQIFQSYGDTAGVRSQAQKRLNEQPGRLLVDDLVQSGSNIIPVAMQRGTATTGAELRKKLLSRNLASRELAESNIDKILGKQPISTIAKRLSKSIEYERAEYDRILGDYGERAVEHNPAALDKINRRIQSLGSQQDEVLLEAQKAFRRVVKGNTLDPTEIGDVTEQTAELTKQLAKKQSILKRAKKPDTVERLNNEITAISGKLKELERAQHSAASRQALGGPQTNIVSQAGIDEQIAKRKSQIEARKKELGDKLEGEDAIKAQLKELNSGKSPFTGKVATKRRKELEKALKKYEPAKNELLSLAGELDDIEAGKFVPALDSLAEPSVTNVPMKLTHMRELHEFKQALDAAIKSGKFKNQNTRYLEELHNDMDNLLKEIPEYREVARTVNVRKLSETAEKETPNLFKQSTTPDAFEQRLGELTQELNNAGFPESVDEVYDIVRIGFRDRLRGELVDSLKAGTVNLGSLKNPSMIKKLQILTGKDAAEMKDLTDMVATQMEVELTRKAMNRNFTRPIDRSALDSFINALVAPSSYLAVNMPGLAGAAAARGGANWARRKFFSARERRSSDATLRAAMGNQIPDVKQARQQLVQAKMRVPSPLRRFVPYAGMFGASEE